MPQLRVAMAQVDTTVGDLDGNVAVILDWTRRAAQDGAHLVLFPETAVTGYPVEDLALRTSFVDASRRAVGRLARRLADDGFGDVTVVVGYVDRVGEDARPGAGGPRRLPQNCAAVLHGGRVVARYAKHHLPNYGVFDEYRIFVPGDDLLVVRVRGVDVAVAICEDLWQDGGPVQMAGDAGAGLLAVLNASPYERDKDDVRLELVARRAAEAGCPIAYVNAVGGQDELVFDGDSLVVAAGGTVLARGPQFREALVVTDLDLPAGVTTPGWEEHVQRVTVTAEAVPAYEPRASEVLQPLPDVAEVHGALVLGLRDYVRKNGFRSVVVAVSGGIDSALVASLACDAIGPENVLGISLPSGYSSQHSRDDAEDLANRCGFEYRQYPIAPMVEAFLGTVPLRGVAEENLQARVRGTTIMGIANQEGHLTLATSNKSELAVGYSTLYGDSVGGYAPLKDVPKTLVWELSRWRNAEALSRGEQPPIPENTITKPPSAELRPDQTDQDSLPPYEVLDAILEDYVEGDRGRAEMLEAGFDATVVDSVVTLVDRAEWKRRQFAPGPKISYKAFGRDRRLPITNRWREPAASASLTPPVDVKTDSPLGQD
ncbi:NAD+ synthase [Kineococcus radiotolerans]|uniref:Glutamine-dependent NAD(+) synthetase n=1 Tax=Kineococcus radiotolerans (strain ATCC BAA-149 / DSM 14245 / SRS30216) TaxID=266940 RepID=A6WD72_KINRD|nr:NAD+ synthase [Kineococcus radiotolerans]ABS04761.1 NAD+ synthetase [Kineococcus radiotolerans SRS30216 = ATCC BAA-149]